MSVNSSALVWDCLRMSEDHYERVEALSGSIGVSRCLSTRALVCENV